MKSTKDDVWAEDEYRCNKEAISYMKDEELRLRSLSVGLFRRSRLYQLDNTTSILNCIFDNGWQANFILKFTSRCIVKCGCRYLVEDFAI